MIKALWVLFNLFIGCFFAYSQEWRIQHKEDGLIVSSKTMPGTDLFAFKCEKRLSHSIASLAEALISDDPEIKKEFVMGLTKFDIWQRQRQPHLQKFKTYTAFNIPFPFSDRDMVVDNRVVVDAIKKTVSIDSHSIEDERYPQEETIGVRFTIQYSKILLQQIDDNHTTVTMEMLGSMNG